MSAEFNQLAFSDAYRHLPPSDINVLAWRIYESLSASGEFRPEYVVQETLLIAQFFRGDDEVCRAVVGRGPNNERSYSAMWICKTRKGSRQDWPEDRSHDFADRFGSMPEPQPPCLSGAARTVVASMSWFAH